MTTTHELAIPPLAPLDTLDDGAEQAMAVADAAPTLLFACRPDGTQAWLNRQWLQFTGLDDLDSLAASWPSLTVAADASPLAPPQGPSEWLEVPFRLRDAAGELRWLHARARLVCDEHGQPVYWAGAANEISSGVGDRAPGEPRDEFLALVSHELRSPLNAIRGWAHVLRKSGELTPMQERALATIERNVANQARLIDDLLDRRRLLQGRAQLEKQRIVLATLMADALDIQRPAAAEKHQELVMECDESLVVDADAQRLRQVLTNLLSNAVKFTPARGRIDLRASRRGDRVCIEVVDTGIGLSPEWVLRAFAPADGSEMPSGLGLGLALTQRLVELHGGRISAASDGPDRGATFRVVLPAPADAARP